MSIGDVLSPTLETRVSTSLETLATPFRVACLQVSKGQRHKQTAAGYLVSSNTEATIRTSGIQSFLFSANTRLLVWDGDPIGFGRSHDRAASADNPRNWAFWAYCGIAVLKWNSAAGLVGWASR